MVNLLIIILIILATCIKGHRSSRRDIFFMTKEAALLRQPPCGDHETFEQNLNDLGVSFIPKVKAPRQLRV